MRLDKFLSDCGYGTRKEVKQYIRNGLVSVNEVMVKKDGFHVDETKDVIALEGDIIAYQKYVYVMLHKPAGYLSANEDSLHPTVFDLLPEYVHLNMFCVGRLDLDTEGLLLICDDGDLAHHLLSPRHHVSKRYEVTLEEPITEEEMTRVGDGIVLADGYQCMPANLWRMAENKVIIEIFEGKFHQVKRMFQQVNNQVIYLRRISMGSLQLDEHLAKGAYRELVEEEVASLRGNSS